MSTKGKWKNKTWKIKQNETIGNMKTGNNWNNGPTGNMPTWNTLENWKNQEDERFG